MHASIIQAWDYLTHLCGHKWLWVKLNPLPRGYTGSTYKHKLAIYSQSGRILGTLDPFMGIWVYSSFTPRCIPADKILTGFQDALLLDRDLASHFRSQGY